MTANSIKNYLSLVKFSHTIFAMPFALIGFFSGVFKYGPVMSIVSKATTGRADVFMSDLSWKRLTLKLILVIFCMVFARSAAMAFNRWLDARYDALNPRTAIREIPAGIISKHNALLFTIVSAVLFVLTCLFINLACAVLAPVALFIILFYSYTKRFTALCHLVLGVGLSLAPVGAYLAVTGKFSALPVLLSLTVLFWVSGFDIIYALQDIAFDRSQKLHSIPAAFGKSKALNISAAFHILSAIFISIAGFYGHFSWLYWVGVIIFTGMLLYQHSIVKPTDLSRVNLAFMTANGIASVVFAFFVLLDIFIYH